MKLLIVEDEISLENEGHSIFIEKEFSDSLLQLKTSMK